MYSSGPRQEPEQASREVSGKLPYETVQSGFRAYWSSCGYQPCDRQLAEAHVTKAVKESIQSLPVDTVLQPELSIERVLVNDRMIRGDGRVAALVEFTNAEGEYCLWYAGRLAKVEAGCGMLAIVTTPREGSYQLHIHLDERAFHAEMNRIVDYSVSADSVEVPVAIQLAENCLQFSGPDPDVRIRRISQFEDRYRAVTNQGIFDLEFSCNTLSRLLHCRVRGCLS